MKILSIILTFCLSTTLVFAHTPSIDSPEAVESSWDKLFEKNLTMGKRLSLYEGIELINKRFEEAGKQLKKTKVMLQELRVRRTLAHHLKLRSAISKEQAFSASDHLEKIDFHSMKENMISKLKAAGSFEAFLLSLKEEMQKQHLQSFSADTWLFATIGAVIILGLAVWGIIALLAVAGFLAYVGIVALGTIGLTMLYFLLSPFIYAFTAVDTKKGPLRGPSLFQNFQKN